MNDKELKRIDREVRTMASQDFQLDVKVEAAVRSSELERIDLIHIMGAIMTVEYWQKMLDRNASGWWFNQPAADAGNQIGIELPDDEFIRIPKTLISEELLATIRILVGYLRKIDVGIDQILMLARHIEERKQ